MVGIIMCRRCTIRFLITFQDAVRYSLVDNLNGNNPLAYFFIISDTGFIYLSQPLTNNANQVDRYQVGVCCLFLLGLRRLDGQEIIYQFNLESLDMIFFFRQTVIK